MLSQSQAPFPRETGAAAAAFWMASRGTKARERSQSCARAVHPQGRRAKPSPSPLSLARATEGAEEESAERAPVGRSRAREGVLTLSSVTFATSVLAIAPSLSLSLSSISSAGGRFLPCPSRFEIRAVTALTLARFMSVKQDFMTGQGGRRERVFEERGEATRSLRSTPPCSATG